MQCDVPLVQSGPTLSATSGGTSVLLMSLLEVLLKNQCAVEDPYGKSKINIDQVQPLLSLDEWNKKNSEQEKPNPYTEPTPEPHIKMDGSRNEQEILAALEKMQNLIYTSKTSKVISDVKGKDIVLFLGNTRSGKSTIVNCAIGNALVANKLRVKSFNIVKKDPNSIGPAIGTGSTSETSIPSAWTSSKIKGVIVDAPGFDDNRGVAQDVANSFCVKEIINSARSVKLALISDITDITSDNIAQFTNFIDKILTMLPHNGNMHKGMVMLFNKDKEGYSVQDISDLLKEKIIDQPSMHVKNRQLVDYLYRNLKQMVIVKTPNSAGLITDADVFGNFVDVIENNARSIPKSEMSNVVPGISDKSENFLNQAHRYFTEMEEFDNVLKLVYDEIVKSLDEYDVPSDTSRDKTIALKKRFDDLKYQIKSIRNNNDSLFEKLAQLGCLVPNVKQLHENSEMLLKLKFVAFVEAALGIKESKTFVVKINLTIADLLKILSQTRVILAEKLNEITQAEALDKLKQIEDDHNKNNKELRQKLKQIEIENEKLKEEQRKAKGWLQSTGEWLDNLFEF